MRTRRSVFTSYPAFSTRLRTCACRGRWQWKHEWGRREGAGAAMAPQTSRPQLAS